MVIVREVELFAGKNIGFQSIGSIIQGNTASFDCKCLPIESGDYQWVVKNDPTDDDTDAVSANFGTFSNSQILITFPIASGSFTVGNKYYFALEVTDGVTVVETIQVSFTVAQGGIDSIGTAILLFLSAVFTVSGEPVTTSNKIVDEQGFGNIIKTVGQNDITATFNTADSSNREAIQSALDDTGEAYEIKNATYDIGAGTLIPSDSSQIAGETREGVTLQGGVKYGWILRNSVATSDVKISNLTIDLDNQLGISGLDVQKGTRYELRNLRFLNGFGDNDFTGGNLSVPGDTTPPSPASWFLKLSTEPSGSDNFINKYSIVDNVLFDTHSGVYEMFAGINIQHAKLSNLTFLNKTGGPQMGLWQKNFDVTVDGATFVDGTGNEAFYLGVGCERINLLNFNFENVGSAVRMPIISDNGNFGFDGTYNVNLQNCHIVGGANSVNGTGMTIGALRDSFLSNFSIEAHGIGLRIIDGLTISTDPLSPTYFDEFIRDTTFSDFTIKNSNPNKTDPAVRGAILIGKINNAETENKFNIRFKNGNIYDDQASPTQLFPIIFSGNMLFQNITFEDCNIRAYTDGVVNSDLNIFSLQGGATIDESVKFIKNSGVASGSNLTDGVLQALGAGKITVTSSFVIPEAVTFKDPALTIEIGADSISGVQKSSSNETIVQVSKILDGGFSSTVGVDVDNGTLKLDTDSITADTAVDVELGATAFINSKQIAGNINNAGTLYIECLEHTGSVTNTGTIIGRIGSTTYP